MPALHRVHTDGRDSQPLWLPSSLPTRSDAYRRVSGAYTAAIAERFRREIGLAPKSTARVIRFEQACDRQRHADRPPLAQIAAEAGYVDQSHLSRDFRTLPDMTATQWLAERPDVIPANAR